MTDVNSLLQSLNEEQKKAVLINDGSLLIFAGAGSGKTRVITTKIAYSINVLGIDPVNILAVTFTNRACNEMKERVARMVSAQDSYRVTIKTFHSFGVWLLRKYGELVGLKPNFKIYDDDDSAVLMQQCFPEANKKEMTKYAKIVCALKDKMQKPSAVDVRLCQCYKKYEEALRKTGNADFADLILKSIEVLRVSKEALDYVHSRFKVILVDEYQDSNNAQFTLLKLLSSGENFICVVGDDDQSIYKFRGAEVSNILNFPNVFPNTQTVVLGKNYRCSSEILDAASDVILHNKTRAPKTLEAASSSGIKPVLYYVNNHEEEASKVIEIIKQKRDLSCAVLYRTNAQSKAFEDAFMLNGIPYVIVGSLKFYEREEVKDCISLMSLLVNPFDSVAYARVVNKPSRKIGDSTVKAVLEASGGMQDLLFTSACLIEDGTVKPVAASGMKVFLDALKRAQGNLGKMPNGELLKVLLEDLGLLDFYAARDKEESGNADRVGNLNQVVNMLCSAEYEQGLEGINNFLEYIMLDPLAAMPGTEKSAAVTLITMHNTKGLEYDVVFAVGMENEIFPAHLMEATREDLEEERRICYVAMTRARKELYLFCASNRFIWGHTAFEHPSMFLDEIKKEHLQVMDLRKKKNDNFSYYDRSASFASFGFNIAKPVQNKPSKFNVKLIKGGSAASSVKVGAKTAAPVVKFKAGDKIQSPVYGNGVIREVRNLGGREILDVAFDSGKTGSFVSTMVNFKLLEQNT